MKLKEILKFDVPLTKLDNILLGLTLFLGLVSVALLFFITNGTPYFILFRKQVIFLLVSIFLLLVILRIPLRIHYSLSYIYLAISFILLVLVLVQGGEVKRWIRLGFFQFQPSEFAKIAWIFALGRFLGGRINEINRLKVIVVSILFAFLLFAFVVAEPDLGTALMFPIILLGMLYAGGASYFNIFLLLSPVLSLITAFHWIAWAIYFLLFIFILYKNSKTPLLSWSFGVLNFLVGTITPFTWRRLYDYQRARILTFVNPAYDPFGAGYQLIQSKIAIGSGGLYGKGLSIKNPYELEFLPARYTDFIFSSFCERFGFIGVVILIAVFFLFLYRMGEIIGMTRHNFSRLVGFGVFTLFFSQIFINIAMTVGLAPITGLPLPFITPGGSALISYMIAVGVLIRIDLENAQK